MIKVLLVDDEPDYSATLAKRLAKRDILAEAAGSGPAALARLEAGDIDVVVLDVKMPDMDGIETLHRIKESHPLVEVIMLSGHADMETAVRGLETGAFDYLMKPMRFEDLLYKIEDAHEKKAGHEKKISARREGSDTGAGR